MSYGTTSTMPMSQLESGIRSVEKQIAWCKANAGKLDAERRAWCASRAQTLATLKAERQRRLQVLTPQGTSTVTSYLPQSGMGKMGFIVVGAAAVGIGVYVIGRLVS